MDDILASIRKILNEDEAAPQPAAADGPQGGSGPVEPADEAMDLTADMMIAPPPAPIATSIEAPIETPVAPTAPVAPPPPAPYLVDMATEPPPPPAPAVPQPASPVAASAASLVSPPAAAAAAAALGQLSRAVAQDRAASISRTMGLSIEDVVREELRPLLKEWLDTHLPPLVERLVRAEIERVMSRAG